MKKIKIVIVLLISVSFGLLGQERVYREYATQRVQQRLLKEYPNLLDKQLKIEHQLANQLKIENHLLDRFIPVIFHVVYKNEEEKISRTQIAKQLQVLNEDFGLSLQSDFIKIQNSFEDKQNRKTQTYEIKLSENLRTALDIKFCLGGLNIGESSINYISTNQDKWSLNDAIKSTKNGGSDSYQPQNNLNIWIGNLEESISGYAQLPGGPEQTDGIVIDYRFFGVGESKKAPYNLGKTLTHLVGSYLGLYELWNENNPCGDDRVSDTPVHSSPNYGCPQYNHISACFDLPSEMVMNFMDNTDDACQTFFTVGQMRRMSKILSEKGPRNNLLKGIVECTPLNTLSKVQTNVLNNNHYQLNLYPNPAQQTVNLSISSPQEVVSKIHIYSTVGNLVYAEKIQLSLGVNEVPIQLNQWKSGIYYLQMQIDNQKLTRKLSIIQQN